MTGVLFVRACALVAALWLTESRILPHVVAVTDMLQRAEAYAVRSGR